MEISEGTRRIALMGTDESHRAGISPITALEARIKYAVYMRDNYLDSCLYALYQEASWWEQRRQNLNEALLLILPTATISERTNA